MEGTIFELFLDVPDDESGQPLQLGRRYGLTIQGVDQTPFFDQPYPNATPPAWIRDYQINFFSPDIIFGLPAVVLTRQSDGGLPFIETWCELVKPRGLVEILVFQLPEFKLVQVLRFHFRTNCGPA